MERFFNVILKKITTVHSYLAFLKLFYSFILICSFQKMFLTEVSKLTNYPQRRGLVLSSPPIFMSGIGWNRIGSTLLFERNCSLQSIYVYWPTDWLTILTWVGVISWLEEPWGTCWAKTRLNANSYYFTSNHINWKKNY